MRTFFSVYLMTWAALASAQIYEEPSWLPPLPPPVDQYCGDLENISEPVISYRISESCSLTDINTVGEYRYGDAQVRKEVMGLANKQMVRRFSGGNFVYFNEVKIELHKASEGTAVLVCIMDMMEKKVFDAKIVRQRVIDQNKNIPYDEPVAVENNQLPNLGIFTYTDKIRYTTNNCPEITR